MSTLMFSWFVGLIAVIIFPIMITMVYTDTERTSRRRDRLRVWQLGTLLSTTMLIIWTTCWVRPNSQELLFADGPLRASAAFGILLSIALGLAICYLDQRQRAQQERLISAVLAP